MTDRALSRLATRIENRDPAALATLRDLPPGHARIIGITGPPGAGKSTLVDALALALRAQNKTLAILAVDPTSRLTGGAILGDRIRMQQHHADPGIFIRSMATRGTMGGLAQATADLARLMSAAGRDYVLIETVGVGQDEMEIAGLADTTLVVLVPGMGDDIQAIKAGIMEIASIFVINKADHPGADRVERELHTEGFTCPIIRTVATTGEGIPALLQAIAAAPAPEPHHAPDAPPEPLSHHAPATHPTHPESAEPLTPPEPLSHHAPLTHPTHPARPEPISHHTPLTHPTHSESAEPLTRPEPTASRDREGAVANQSFAPDAPPEPLSHHAPADPTLDHLGIAVPNLAQALTFYQSLGLPLTHRELIPTERVEVAILSGHIELLEPTAPDSPIAKFLEKRGPGLHHIALRVPDLNATVAALTAAGARLLNEPRTGAGGHTYVFVHPSSTGGVLLELIQEHT